MFTVGETVREVFNDREGKIVEVIPIAGMETFYVEFEDIGTQAFYANELERVQ
jgi:hypothetical protein